MSASWPESENFHQQAKPCHSPMPRHAVRQVPVLRILALVLRVLHSSPPGRPPPIQPANSNEHRPLQGQVKRPVRSIFSLQNLSFGPSLLDWLRRKPHIPFHVHCPLQSRARARSPEKVQPVVSKSITITLLPAPSLTLLFAHFHYPTLFACRSGSPCHLPASSPSLSFPLSEALCKRLDLIVPSLPGPRARCSSTNPAHPLPNPTS